MGVASTRLRSDDVRSAMSTSYSPAIPDAKSLVHGTSLPPESHNLYNSRMKHFMELYIKSCEATYNDAMDYSAMSAENLTKGLYLCSQYNQIVGRHTVRDDTHAPTEADGLLRSFLFIIETFCSELLKVDPSGEVKRSSKYHSLGVSEENGSEGYVQDGVFFYVWRVENTDSLWLSKMESRGIKTVLHTLTPLIHVPMSTNFVYGGGVLVTAITCVPISRNTNATSSFIGKQIFQTYMTSLTTVNKDAASVEPPEGWQIHYGFDGKVYSVGNYAWVPLFPDLVDCWPSSVPDKGLGRPIKNVPLNHLHKLPSLEPLFSPNRSNALSSLTFLFSNLLVDEILPLCASLAATENIVDVLKKSHFPKFLFGYLIHRLLGMTVPPFHFIVQLQAEIIARATRNLITVKCIQGVKASISIESVISRYLKMVVEYVPVLRSNPFVETELIPYIMRKYCLVGGLLSVDIDLPADLRSLVYHRCCDLLSLTISGNEVIGVGWYGGKVPFQPPPIYDKTVIKNAARSISPLSLQQLSCISSYDTRKTIVTKCILERVPPNTWTQVYWGAMLGMPSQCYELDVSQLGEELHVLDREFLCLAWLQSDDPVVLQRVPLVASHYPTLQKNVAEVCKRLAVVFFQRDDVEEGMRLFRQSIAGARQYFHSDIVSYARHLHNLAEILLGIKLFPQASALVDEGLEAMGSLGAASEIHPVHLKLRSLKAQSMFGMGQRLEALKLFKLLATATQQASRPIREVAKSFFYYGMYLHMEGRQRAAKNILDHTLELFQQVTPIPAEEVNSTLKYLAKTNVQLRLEAAIFLQQRLKEFIKTLREQKNLTKKLENEKGEREAIQKQELGQRSSVQAMQVIEHNLVYERYLVRTETKFRKDVMWSGSPYWIDFHVLFLNYESAMRTCLILLSEKTFDELVNSSSDAAVRVREDLGRKAIELLQQKSLMELSEYERRDPILSEELRSYGAIIAEGFELLYYETGYHKGIAIAAEWDQRKSMMTSFETSARILLETELHGDMLIMMETIYRSWICDEEMESVIGGYEEIIGDCIAAHAQAEHEIWEAIQIEIKTTLQTQLCVHEEEAIRKALWDQEWEECMELIIDGISESYALKVSMEHEIRCHIMQSFEFDCDVILLEQTEQCQRDEITLAVLPAMRSMYEVFCEECLSLLASWENDDRCHIVQSHEFVRDALLFEQTEQCQREEIFVAVIPAMRSMYEVFCIECLSLLASWENDDRCHLVQSLKFNLDVILFEQTEQCQRDEITLTVLPAMRSMYEVFCEECLSLLASWEHSCWSLISYSKLIHEQEVVSRWCVLTDEADTFVECVWEDAVSDFYSLYFESERCDREKHLDAFRNGTEYIQMAFEEYFIRGTVETQWISELMDVVDEGCISMFCVLLEESEVYFRRLQDFEVVCYQLLPSRVFNEEARARQQVYCSELSDWLCFQAIYEKQQEMSSTLLACVQDYVGFIDDIKGDEYANTIQELYLLYLYGDLTALDITEEYERETTVVAEHQRAFAVLYVEFLYDQVRVEENGEWSAIQLDYYQRVIIMEESIARDGNNKEQDEVRFSLEHICHLNRDECLSRWDVVRAWWDPIPMWSTMSIQFVVPEESYVRAGLERLQLQEFSMLSQRCLIQRIQDDWKDLLRTFVLIGSVLIEQRESIKQFLQKEQTGRESLFGLFKEACVSSQLYLLEGQEEDARRMLEADIFLALTPESLMRLYEKMHYVEDPSTKTPKKSLPEIRNPPPSISRRGLLQQNGRIISPPARSRTVNPSSHSSQEGPVTLRVYDANHSMYVTVKSLDTEVEDLCEIVRMKWKLPPTKILSFVAPFVRSEKQSLREVGLHDNSAVMFEIHHSVRPTPGLRPTQKLVSKPVRLEPLNSSPQQNHTFPDTRPGTPHL